MNYAIFKLIHLIAVMLFLGNIITGLFWMHFAVKTKDLKIIHHTMKIIIKADKYFTIPGVIIITAAGIFSALMAHFPILKTGWIFWSIVLFTASGLAFTFKVAPLQKSIYKLTSGKDNLSESELKLFQRDYRQWDIWGVFAILTPLIAFVLMTLKIPQ